jgi:hypothetical protein
MYCKKVRQLSDTFDFKSFQQNKTSVISTSKILVVLVIIGYFEKRNNITS